MSANVRRADNSRVSVEGNEIRLPMKSQLNYINCLVFKLIMIFEPVAR